MSSEANLKLRKVMLVSTKSSDPIRHCLIAMGNDVVQVKDGEGAIFKAQHTSFDIAVLESTGRTMDMPETALNLRDARPSMPIVVMRTNVTGEEAEVIARACPNARLLTTADELTQYFLTQSCA
jgi:DNA-binding response OmpR family regulator